MGYEKLTPSERGSLDEINKRIERVYPKESKADDRKVIKEQLLHISSLYNEIKNANPAEVGKRTQALADYVFSLIPNEGVRQNVEMLAGEKLLKAGQFITDEAVLVDLLDALIQRASATDVGAERGYYLGLLHHFTSPSNYEQIEQDLRARQVITGESLGQPSSDSRAEDLYTLARTVPKYQKAAKTLYERVQGLVETEEYSSPLSRDYVHAIRYIVDDFAENSNASQEERDEINLAKLLSRYYQNDPSELERNLDLGEVEKSDEDTTHEQLDDGEHTKYYLWALRAGYHPSKEKIEQAKKVGTPLTRFRVADKAQYESGIRKTYRDRDRAPLLSDQQGALFYALIREQKDARNMTEVRRLQRDLLDCIWRVMERDDPESIREIGNKGNALVLVYTIRDKIDRDKRHDKTEEQLEERIYVPGPGETITTEGA